MVVQLVGLLLVVVSVAAVAVTVRRVHSVGGFGADGFLVLMLCFAPTLSIIVSALAGGRFVVSDGVGGETFDSVENWALSNGLKVIVALAAIAYTFVGIVAGRLENPPMLLLALASTFAMFGSGLAGYPIWNASTAVMVVVFLAFAFVSDRERVDLAVTVFAVFVVASSALLLLMNPAIATLACRNYKCGPLGEIVVGIFNNENQIAIPLALSLVMVARTFSGRQRVFMCLYVLSFIVITGSRTSTWAAIVFVGAMLVLTGFNKLRRATGAAIWFAAVVTVLVALCLPFLNDDPRLLTGRGRLWDAALSLWQSSPLVGVGMDPWRELVSRGVVATNAGSTPSNMWVDSLMVSGILGTVLFVGSIVWTILRAESSDRSMLSLSILLAGMIGISESPLIYADAASPGAYFLPALLIASGSARTRRGPILQSRLAKNPARRGAGSSV